MIKFEWIEKNAKIVCFAAGAVAAIAGSKILKSDKTRQACVTGLAKGMKLKKDAEEAFKNMKEDAEDICREAQVKLYEDESDDTVVEEAEKK